MSLFFNNALYKFDRPVVDTPIIIKTKRKRKKKKKKEEVVLSDNKLLQLILKQLKGTKKPKAKAKKKGRRFKKKRYGLGKSKKITSPQKPGETDAEYANRVSLDKLSGSSPLLQLLARNISNSNKIPQERVNEIYRLISNTGTEMEGFKSLNRLLKDVDEETSLSFQNTPLGRQLQNRISPSTASVGGRTEFENRLLNTITPMDMIEDRRRSRSREQSPPLQRELTSGSEIEEVFSRSRQKRRKDALKKQFPNAPTNAPPKKEWYEKDTGDEPIRQGQQEYLSGLEEQGKSTVNSGETLDLFRRLGGRISQLQSRVLTEEEQEKAKVIARRKAFLNPNPTAGSIYDMANPKPYEFVEPNV